MIELTVAWYWVVNVILTLIGLGIANQMFKCAFRSTLWNVVAVIFAVLVTISPIKIDGTNSEVYQTVQTNKVAAAKELPPKVEADYWQKKFTNGITPEDLK